MSEAFWAGYWAERLRLDVRGVACGEGWISAAKACTKDRSQRNLQKTARKLLRNQDIERIQQISKRMTARYGDDQIFSAAEELLAESSEARDRKKTADEWNPKRLQRSFESELQKENPSISKLRRLAKVARRGADSIESVNENLALSLETLAAEFEKESEVRSTAKELKRAGDQPFAIVGGRPQQTVKYSANVGGMTLTGDKVYSYPSSALKDIQGRLQQETDPWLRQAVMQERLGGMLPEGTLMVDRETGKTYRRSRQGYKLAWQEADLSDEEKRWLRTDSLFWAGYNAIMRADDIGQWFDENWVRISSEGNIMGPCGDRSAREAKPKCLPEKRARAMSKAARAAAVRRKRRQDPNENRTGKARMVSTEGKR